MTQPILDPNTMSYDELAKHANAELQSEEPARG
jgi:hypothetical protein